MTGPICEHCGHYLISAAPGHNEDTCRDERQRVVNARGAARARAAHRAARNEHHPEPETDPTP